MNLEEEVKLTIKEIDARLNRMVTNTFDQEEISQGLYAFLTETEIPKRQLVLFKSKLEIILQDLHMKQFSYYKPCLAHFVYESWPVDDVLANKIAKIENEYMKLRNNIEGRYDPPSIGYSNTI